MRDKENPMRSGSDRAGTAPPRMGRQRPNSMPTSPTDTYPPDVYRHPRSSVDLTPTLLSMYDRLNSTSNGNIDRADDLQNNHHGMGKGGLSPLPAPDNVNLLAREECRYPEMDADSPDSGTMAGQKRPLSVDSSNSLPAQMAHKRQNLGDDQSSKSTSASLADSGVSNTSTDSMTTGDDDWLSVSRHSGHSTGTHSDQYYEDVDISLGGLPAVKVYSPQNSTGSADNVSLNSSCHSEKGDNSPVCGPMQSTFSLKLRTDQTSESSASLKSTNSASLDNGVLGDRNSVQSVVLSKDAKYYVSYAQRVASEIVETEKSYVHSLQEIIQGYMNHLRACDQISLAQADQLFGNLEDIYNFNRELLCELEDCGEDPVEMARCFVEKKEGFNIYTQYCTNYPASMEVLTNCMMQASLAEKFKSWQAALGHGLPLGAFLLKPVQRILKYHLLLQNIVKHYESDRPGYDMLTTALDQMTQIARHINEMKRRHEHAVRVQEVQSQLDEYDGPDLTTLGELKLEGSFRLLGAKASRSVFLFEKGIVITKRKEDGMFTCKAVIVCSNLMLVESIAKEPLSFHVIPFDNTKLQYTLQARTLEMKRKWCQEIKRLILESYMGKIPDKVKSLVMGLGKTRDEEEEEYNSQSNYLGVEDKKPRRKSANLMDLVKLKKGHRKSETTPPRLAPVDVPLQASAGRSTSRLQPKQSNKSMSGSRSMDNLSISGSHTIPRTKAPSSAETSPENSRQQNGHGDADDLSRHFTFVESDPNRLKKDSSQVSRAKSFKMATRINPVRSISLSDGEGSSSDSVEISSDEDENDDQMDEDVYVRLRYNNDNGDAHDRCGMSYGSRGASMPALNTDLDEPDYVTMRLRPEDGLPVSSNNHHTATHTRSFECLSAEDMIADNKLISERVENAKGELMCASSSSSYDNLHKRWSHSSSNQGEDLEEGVSNTIVPPPKEFADVEQTLLSRNTCNESAASSGVNPWVKRIDNSSMCQDVTAKGNKSVRCSNKRHYPLGKSYSFPLGEIDAARCTSQESFDWFVYSNRLASSLAEKFDKMKVLDKQKKSKAMPKPRYPAYVSDLGAKDSYSLQQRKTIVRYGTPPRSLLTMDNVNQYNSRHEQLNKSASFKSSTKFQGALSKPKQWAKPTNGVIKYKTDKTKKHTLQERASADPNKMVKEVGSYSEKHSSQSSLHSSSSSLTKFPPQSSGKRNSTEDKFRFPPDSSHDKGGDSWSENSRDSVHSANFMSRSRESLASSTSSLNKPVNGECAAAQEGFVGSLRSKLSHLTARLTARKQTPNINSTFNLPRSLSTGNYTSAYNSRYKPSTPRKPEGFVSHLTRIYNAREQTPPPRGASPKRVTTTPERITNYATVLRNRQLGSPAVGSRLATSTTAPDPKVRSLPRQLTAPQHTGSDAETSSETNSVHSLDFSKDKSPERLYKIEFPSNSIEQSDSAVSVRSHISPDETPISPLSIRPSSCCSMGSTDSIYERRFSRALEEPEDNVFRDSAVYSDIDTGYNFTAPKRMPATPRKSIREVVQQLEERARPKQPEVVDVRRREPGRTIQEKLKSLQESSTYRRRSHHFEDDLESYRPLKDVRRSLGSSQSSIEKEEASYSIRYSRGHSETEDAVKMSRSTGRLDQIDNNNVNTLLTMKGWVRQLINKFQTDQ